MSLPDSQFVFSVANLEKLIVPELGTHTQDVKLKEHT